VIANQSLEDVAATIINDRFQTTNTPRPSKLPSKVEESIEEIYGGWVQRTFHRVAPAIYSQHGVRENYYAFDFCDSASSADASGLQLDLLNANAKATNIQNGEKEALEHLLNDMGIVDDQKLKAETDCMVIPWWLRTANPAGHFHLMGLAPKQRFVYSIDSCTVMQQEYRSSMRHLWWIFETTLKHEETDWPLYEEWAGAPRKDKPGVTCQSDSYNCGVSTCINAWNLMAGFSLRSYVSSDLDKYKRPRMTVELMSGDLNNEGFRYDPLEPCPDFETLTGVHEDEMFRKVRDASLSSASEEVKTPEGFVYDHSGDTYPIKSRYEAKNVRRAEQQSVLEAEDDENLAEDSMDVTMEDGMAGSATAHYDENTLEDSMDVAREEDASDVGTTYVDGRGGGWSTSGSEVESADEMDTEGMDESSPSFTTNKAKSRKPDLSRFFTGSGRRLGSSQERGESSRVGDRRVKHAWSLDDDDNNASRGSSSRRQAHRPVHTSSTTTSLLSDPWPSQFSRDQFRRSVFYFAPRPEILAYFKNMNKEQLISWCKAETVPIRDWQWWSKRDVVTFRRWVMNGVMAYDRLERIREGYENLTPPWEDCVP
jgi:hypothetical protein